MSLTLKSVSMWLSPIVLRNMNKSTTILTSSRASLRLLMLTTSLTEQPEALELLEALVLEELLDTVLDMEVFTTRGLQTQEIKVTPAVLTVRTRRRSSATSTPRRTPVRFPSKPARRLLTQSTLSSVRKESILSVRRLMKEDITALVLSLTTPTSLPPHHTQGIRHLLGKDTTRNSSFVFSFSK